ncbi:uncharacterized protein LOC143297865 [Babylonia areolata]|uniref:uncharacterized protein LOC143297865 n=1 Tax=Babylonia areolata TaxID=304850 RepID=UPI003FD148F5
MDAILYQLKTAAAIAVLRTKPAEVDAYHYTKELCTKYLQAQTQWRSRYLQAQDALLHLEQQQIICLTQSDGPICPPTPPSSAPDASGSGQTIRSVSHQQALVSSYQFIHSVVSLARAVVAEPSQSSRTDEASQEERHTSPTELLSRLDCLLSDTVPSCVRYLRAVVSKGDTDVSTHCVMQALDGLMLLLDDAELMDAVSSGCQSWLLLEQLGGLVDDLLERLFGPASYLAFQHVQTRKLLHQMLLKLTTRMRTPEKYSLLHSLAGHVKSACVSLTRDVSNGSPINPDCYESLGIALDCLQQGVASITVGDIDVESLKEIQQEMEQELDSHLMYHFPLVTRTVLRLTSLMELCCKSSAI